MVLGEGEWGDIEGVTKREAIIIMVNVCIYNKCGIGTKMMWRLATAYKMLKKVTHILHTDVYK